MYIPVFWFFWWGVGKSGMSKRFSRIIWGFLFKIEKKRKSQISTGFLPLGPISRYMHTDHWHCRLLSNVNGISFTRTNFWVIESSESSNTGTYWPLTDCQKKCWILGGKSRETQIPCWDVDRLFNMWPMLHTVLILCGYSLSLSTLSNPCGKNHARSPWIFKIGHVTHLENSSSTFTQG